MRRKFVILLVVLALPFFWSCKKKIFEKVEIKGTLLDYITNQPVISKVYLLGDDNNKGHQQPNMKLKTVETDNNGNFVINVRALRSNKYYLNFNSISKNAVTGFYDNSGRIDNFSVSDNGVKDFGNLYESSHTFYCKITLNYTSNLQNDIYIGTQPHIIFFPYGTNTQTITTVQYTKTEFENHNHKFDFTYTLLGPGIDNGGSVSIPIINNDTVYTTINY